MKPHLSNRLGGSFRLLNQGTANFGQTFHEVRSGVAFAPCFQPVCSGFQVACHCLIALPIRGWKSRFFVLRKRSAVLQYYASKEAFQKGDLPKGIIDLTLCEHPHTRSNKGTTFEKQKQGPCHSSHSRALGFLFSCSLPLTSPRFCYSQQEVLQHHHDDEPTKSLPLLGPVSRRSHALGQTDW